MSDIPTQDEMDWTEATAVGSERGLFDRGDQVPGADPAQYVRRDDSGTSHEAAARAAPTMGRRPYGR